MNINYLREFVVLAEHLNYSTAAESMYITQSALSRHISLLEQYFNVQLFYRNTQSVKLTNEGLTLYKNIIPLLNEFDELREKLLTQTQNVASEFRIGLPYFAMNDYLGELPNLFQVQYPHIKLSYFSADPDINIEALFERKIDITFIANEPFAGAKDLVFHDIFIEPLIILLSEKHSLAAQSDLFLQQLADEIFLVIDSDYYSVLWSKIRNLCLQNGFEPKGPIKYRQMESILMDIRYRGGVTIVGNHLKILAKQGIKWLRIKNENCVRQLSLAYLKDNKNPALPLFLKAFDEHEKGKWIL